MMSLNEVETANGDLNQYDNEGRKIGYWEETTLMSLDKGFYIKGLREGYWEEYTGSGVSKGYYVDDKKEGLWLAFDKEKGVLGKRN